MKKKVIFAVIFLLIGSSITYGAEMISGKSVAYDNNTSGLNSSNVQDAIAEVYNKCNIEDSKNLYNLIKNNADKITQIDFNINSKTGNTNGIYTTNKTNSGKNVYYYRGNVDNNIIYNNMCWKIIRTTESGGVKLIYNGSVNNGRCANTGDDTQIDKIAFNSKYNDNAYVGYMYGSAGASTYVETHTNTNSSTIKTYIDNWFSTNFDEEAQSYLEDEVFCVDRNIKAYDKTLIGHTNFSSYGILGYGSSKTIYGTSFRAWYYSKEVTPTLVCENTNGTVSEFNDSFTVSPEKGNGALTYPVGLITLDEAVYAGYNTYSSNTSDYQDITNYLYTGNDYWTLSPVSMDMTGYAHVGYIQSSGYVNSRNVNVIFGIRPVLSLKLSINVSGYGSENNPYVVL